MEGSPASSLEVEGSPASSPLVKSMEVEGSPASSPLVKSMGAEEAKYTITDVDVNKAKEQMEEAKKQMEEAAKPLINAQIAGYTVYQNNPMRVTYKSALNTYNNAMFKYRWLLIEKGTSDYGNITQQNVDFAETKLTEFEEILNSEENVNEKLTDARNAKVQQDDRVEELVKVAEGKLTVAKAVAQAELDSALVNRSVKEEYSTPQEYKDMAEFEYRRLKTIFFINNSVLAKDFYYPSYSYMAGRFIGMQTESKQLLNLINKQTNDNPEDKNENKIQGDFIWKWISIKEEVAKAKEGGILKDI